MGLIIPYKFEEEKREAKLTGLTGILLPLELMYAMELDKEIQKQIKARPDQGYTDGKEIISLILLNLAGGEHVADIELLRGDIGFSELAKEASDRMINPQIAKQAKKRFRKLQEEGFPSPSAILRYLFEFHDEQEEARRLKSEHLAFIPRPNEHLQGLQKVNCFIAGYKQRLNPQEVATLDLDATVIETSKSEALFCYKGYKSYQPINTYWYEQGIVILSEFRDGNVPASYENLRILQESLEQVPKGVKTVRFRADTAAYQHEILRYCEEGKNERFGRIEFAISCDVTPEFRKAVRKIEESEWGPLKRKLQGEYVESDQQWAEVCFVPNEIASRAKKDSFYRYIAIREPFEPNQKHKQDSSLSQSLHIEEINGKKYKIFGIVTNMKWEGQDLVLWQRERCGKSEEAHSIMKEDLAGGILPSKYFGSNAAWWMIMILAFNILRIFQHHILPPQWKDKRIKALHFHIFHLPALVLKHARQWIVRLTAGHPSNSLLFQARKKILLLSQLPAG